MIYYQSEVDGGKIKKRSWFWSILAIFGHFVRLQRRGCECYRQTVESRMVSYDYSINNLHFDILRHEIVSVWAYLHQRNPQVSYLSQSVENSQNLWNQVWRHVMFQTSSHIVNIIFSGHLGLFWWVRTLNKPNPSKKREIWKKELFQLLPPRGWTNHPHISAQGWNFKNRSGDTEWLHLRTAHAKFQAFTMIRLGCRGGGLKKGA